LPAERRVELPDFLLAILSPIVFRQKTGCGSRVGGMFKGSSGDYLAHAVEER
jgi:hypothetical protein